MEGWMQRLFTTLVLAVIVLLVAFAALAFGLPWPAVAAIAFTLFAAMVAIQLVVEMRRDVRMLKNQALELSGYESEIGRRVDYLASLVERSGGAAPDELAKRVRAVNHQFSQFTAETAQRLDRIEQEFAELALSPRQPVAVPVPRPAAKDAPRPAAKDAPRSAAKDVPRPGPKDAPLAATPRKAEDAKSAERPATVIPMKRPSARAAQAAAAPSPDGSAAQWRKAIAGEQLTFHLLPALSLPERTPALYEAVMRLRADDGSWTEPDALIEAAARHGLAALVERKTLYTAARMLRSVKRMGKDMRLIAPLSGVSLADERGFSELRNFLDAAPDLRDGLTLEIAQGDFRALPSEARQRVGLVADAGFQLSLGAMGDTRTDPQTLRQLGFTLARAPVSLIMGERGEESSLAVSLAAHRIELIATGIEDESVLPGLIDRDVGLAQGLALSAPRLVKPDLLQAAAPAAKAPITKAPVATTPATKAPATKAVAS